MNEEAGRLLRSIAKLLKDQMPPNVGFSLFLFTGDTGEEQIISTGQREDVTKLLREWLVDVAAGRAVTQPTLGDGPRGHTPLELLQTTATRLGAVIGPPCAASGREFVLVLFPYFELGWAEWTASVDERRRLGVLQRWLGRQA